VNTLDWQPFDKKTAPRSTPLLVYIPDSRRPYHVGYISENGVMIVGGLFDFDMPKITAYALFEPCSI